MKKFLRKNKKYIGLILIAAMVFNFVLLPLTALAADTDPIAATGGGGLIGWLTGEVLLFISSFISYVLSSIFGVVLQLEAQIIDYIIDPANFSLVSSTIVTNGWGITRDLANMFFILILLIIAFATVLKIQSYAIKQLWWKVLVAALLINFSLVIAGFVIDFTQVLTTFFLHQITGGAGTMTTRLAFNMNILNFYNPTVSSSALEGAAQVGKSGIAAILGIVLTLVGLVITVFVFGAAAMFLIVRILYIWFLLIIAPIVWMLWILPATSKFFSQWWDKFIQWAFFAPIYVFMIYLSLSIFNAQGNYNPGNFSAGNADWTKAAPGLTTVSMPSAIFQWILVIAMMFGSLIVAQKFGVEGAAGARKILTGWGTGAKNWAGRQLRRQALGVGAKEAAPGVAARPGLLVRGAQKLAAIPGGRLLAGQIFKMTAAEAGTVKAAQDQFANWTPDAIQAYLEKSPGRITSPFVQNQQMGAALALKEKGKLDKLGEPRIKELAALASKQYAEHPEQLNKILEVAPHLATEFNKNIKEVVAKIDKAEQVMLSSLGDIEVVTNFSPDQLRDIVRKGNDEKIKQVKTVVDRAIQSLRDVNPTLANRVEKVASITKKEERNQELRDLTKDNEHLGKLARTKFVTSSPAWDI